MLAAREKDPVAALPRRGPDAGVEQEENVSEMQDLINLQLTVLQDILAYIYDSPNNCLIHTIGKS